MGNPFYQNFDPMPVPPPVTPADSPGSPENYAGVTPHGPGTAPYDVQAPQQDLAALVTAAGDLTGAGVIYPQGPRQAMIESLLSSAQGYGEQDITAGWSGGGGDTGWPANVEPPGM
jgi:hypothetical protein